MSPRCLQGSSFWLRWWTNIVALNVNIHALWGQRDSHSGTIHIKIVTTFSLSVCQYVCLCVHSGKISKIWQCPTVKILRVETLLFIMSKSISKCWSRSLVATITLHPLFMTVHISLSCWFLLLFMHGGKEGGPQGPSPLSSALSATTREVWKLKSTNKHVGWQCNSPSCCLVKRNFSSSRPRW